MDGPPPPKPRFYEICKEHQIDGEGLVVFASQSGISPIILTAMYRGDPVRPDQAREVLEAFSKYVTTAYTLIDIDIPTSKVEGMY